jgi:hypothetical protein
MVKGVTKLTSGVPGDDYYETPGLAALNGGRALLVYDGPNGISYTVINSAGGIVKAETATGGWGYRPDAVQLSDGSIVVAWEGTIEFVIIDGTTYDKTYGPSWLSNPAAITGDAYVSVAADEAGHAIVTWMDSDWSYRQNLYYALLDGSGNVLTDPMVFRTSQAPTPRIESSYSGYGNTSYSLITPTTSGVDARLSSFLASAPPDGTAAIVVSIGNYGSTSATSVVLTATMDSSLDYEGASFPPTSTGGESVVWSLPSMDFLGHGQIILHTHVPSATIGTRYPVLLYTSSFEPEANPSDNDFTAEVMISHQVFLPPVFRDY